MPALGRNNNRQNQEAELEEILNNLKNILEPILGEDLLLSFQPPVPPQHAVPLQHAGGQSMAQGSSNPTSLQPPIQHLAPQQTSVLPLQVPRVVVNNYVARQTNYGRAAVGVGGAPVGDGSQSYAGFRLFARASETNPNSDNSGCVFISGSGESPQHPKTPQKFPGEAAPPDSDSDSESEDEKAN